MPEGGWFQLLSAAFGGGITVKALDIAYQELRQRSDHAKSAKRFVDENLDPLLKAADELTGKLRSLAENDFRTLHDLKPDSERLESHDLGSLLFLFGKFWARVEIFRHEGLSVALSEDERGRKLQNFLDCMESRRVRIVDRISQRAMGEVMIASRSGNMTTIPFIEFVKAFESGTETRRWVYPLATVLTRTRHTYERQRLLQYGVVLHALIDVLDPKHLVTRERPSYPNKLTKRSWQALKYRIFGQYLRFVENPGKYLGPPKTQSKRAQKR